ncbi:right-handed parallel beta-helix repeat-containing protein [Micromonospora sp. STR1_7]|uniref:Right-handed parallel beta-helix repeat-containing protein n=1 Tax=Micromonospora parastrephiae TaxID=2806101 RepID=A0ABS1XY14_9ACTN|nr:right-handed parallel beta-helix repeat-containing protein [Micromonospora parastrephiae]MBM0234039.1 right-handed parallel beta-helix repeat-containing protein [Micromonospora parastrephiae]
MDIRRWARLALVPLIGGAALVGPTVPAAAAPAPVAAAPVAAAAASDELYVSEHWCQSSGDGSEQRPFCTISEAAAVAGPGQTVLIHPGEYPEKVRFTRSGSESAPITFRAVNVDWQMARVGRYNTAAVTGTILDLSGVHDVTVEGLVVFGAPYADAVTVRGSQRVRLDKLSVETGSYGPSGVRISGASSRVTLSRSFVYNPNGPSVAVEPGVTDTTVTASQFDGSGLTATDAPRLTVTGNTFHVDCRRGIDLAGSSPGASIRNNIVVTTRQRHVCKTPADAVGVRLSAESVAGSSTDYNLFDPTSGGMPYTWAGTDHPTLASFVAATGQAAHDLSADPKLTLVNGWDRVYLETRDGSPARDSADANAPGALDTDMLDGSFADDPAAPNTGTGSGYRDRGSVEARGPVTQDPLRVERKIGGGPFDVVARSGTHFAWPVERERTKYAYYLTGRRFWRVTDSATAEYTLRRAGDACVQVQASQTDFRLPTSNEERVCTQVGARYVPVTPTRLLDTRARIGVPDTRPVTAWGTVELPVGSIAGVAQEDISAVVLNVTVTQPDVSGFIRVDSTGAFSGSSNLNFVKGETVPNQVTVPVIDGSVRFTNYSSGTVHLVADLQGFYAANGSGFASVSPTRVLDTRAGTGTPFPAMGTRPLDLSEWLPVGATAAVLSVTVTAPTTSGVLTVYPYGSTAPTASSLNFVAGQTIPNLVTVPVVNGRVSILNNSSGTTHVVADLAGWFSPDATQTFVPMTSTRIVDSRDSTGLPGRTPAPLAAGETVRFAPFKSDVICAPACPAPTAVVGNVTVTAPTRPGVLTVHPGGGQRPTASNVNFVAGETASNAAVVAVGSGVDLFHNSGGTSHVIVDQSGYFIAAAS